MIVLQAGIFTCVIALVHCMLIMLMNVFGTCTMTSLWEEDKEHVTIHWITLLQNKRAKLEHLIEDVFDYIEMVHIPNISEMIDFNL